MGHPHHLPTVLIDEVMNTTAQFYGDESLKKLPRQIASGKPLLKYVLCMVSTLHKSYIGTVLLLWVLLCVYPRKWFSSGPTHLYVVSLTQNNTRALNRLAPEIKELGWDFQINHSAMAWLMRFRLLRQASKSASLLRNKGSSDPFLFLNQEVI